LLPLVYTLIIIIILSRSHGIWQYSTAPQPVNGLPFDHKVQRIQCHILLICEIKYLPHTHCVSASVIIGLAPHWKFLRMVIAEAKPHQNPHQRSVRLERTRVHWLVGRNFLINPNYFVETRFFMHFSSWSRYLNF
jgi:hypothetical protein